MSKELLKTKLLEKKAGWAQLVSGAKNLLSTKPMQLAGNVAAIAGTGMLLGAGVNAMSSLGSAVSDPLMRKVGFNRMMRENEWLKHEDPGTVKKFYDTLFRFAPSMAEDPLVAGSFMKRSLEFKDAGIQMGDVNTMVGVQRAVNGDRKGSLDAMKAVGDIGKNMVGDKTPALLDPAGSSGPGVFNTLFGL